MTFATHTPDGDGMLVEELGLAFDDLQPGQIIEHRPAIVFAFAESAYRARIAGDHAPVAVDAEFAALVGGGRPVIYEPWVLCQVIAVTTRAFGRVVANLGWEKVTMLVPARDGDRALAESRILGKRDSASRPGQGILHVETSATVGGTNLVCRFERRLLMYK